MLRRHSLTKSYFLLFSFEPCIFVSSLNRTNSWLLSLLLTNYVIRQARCLMEVLQDIVGRLSRFNKVLQIREILSKVLGKSHRRKTLKERRKKAISAPEHAQRALEASGQRAFSLCQMPYAPCVLFREKKKKKTALCKLGQKAYNFNRNST